MNNENQENNLHIESNNTAEQVQQQTALNVDNSNLNTSNVVTQQPSLEETVEISKELQNNVIQNLNDENEEKPGVNNLNNTSKRKTKKVLVRILIVIIAILIALVTILFLNKDNTDTNSTTSISGNKYKSEYRISGNSLEPFDLYFLQLENGKENKIYSPLSIKYALEMLMEGADGDSKAQIEAIIGDYEAKKYINSENMSFANAMFIKDTLKDSIKQDYISKLQNTFNAEIVFDPFTSADNINTWVKNKTLNLIDGLVDDVSNLDFALINALAIDMEWEEKFILHPSNGVWAQYEHEKIADDEWGYAWVADRDVVKSSFKNVANDISGMEIKTSINNYDAIKELGEENIRNTVENEYRNYIKQHPEESVWYDDIKESKLYKDLTEEELNTHINDYLNNYIKQISANYKKVFKTTNFSIYTDNDVKAFAKDLKEYNGTTLQYVGIMPNNIDLDSYVSNIDIKKVNEIISGLKEIKPENFNDGVITEISGYIPKFKFEYELNLKEDLGKLGITDVFDSNKSNLTNLTSQRDIRIVKTVHKANIEFTQEGIKAAAATAMGGVGAGGGFDYFFEVPIEKIDLTFDKPYMFIIRDKNSGEVWFTGTVYEPLLWADDTTKAHY